MSEEDGKKKTQMEEKKNIMQLPKEEHLAWALLTGANMMFATGLLLLLQGLSVKDIEQIVTFVSAVIVFGFGGYCLHCYNRWLTRNIKQ
jgi:hypothetical protein